MIVHAILYWVVQRLFIMVSAFVAFVHHLKPSGVTREDKHDLDYILQHIHYLKKVPGHIAIVVEEASDGGVNVKQIAKVITWSMGSGIQHITVYDFHGHVARHSQGLRQAVAKKGNQFLSTRRQALPPARSQAPSPSPSPSPLQSQVPGQSQGQGQSQDDKTKECTIIWHVGSTIQSDHERFETTMYISSSDVTPVNNTFNIYIASADNSRKELTTITYDICKSILQGEDSPDNISPAFINSNTKGLPPATPEPDLMVHFGGPLVMSGFMPWHIRLTEIMCMGTLADFTLQSFISSLYSYAKTEKRFGV